MTAPRGAFIVDVYLVTLPAIMAVLWLCEPLRRYRYFDHPGWTTLFVLGIAGIGLLLLAAWMLLDLLLGRHVHFSLRTLALGVLCIVVPCARHAADREEARRMQAAIADFEPIGFVRDDWRSDAVQEDVLSRLRKHFLGPQGREVFVGKAPENSLAGVLHPFSQLEYLTFVPGSKGSDENLQGLSAFPCFQALDADGAKITDRGAKYLSACTNLRVVLLPYSQVTDAGVEEILTLPHLVGLNLVGTPITSASVERLAAKQSLRRLDVRGCALTPADLARLRAVLPHCTIPAGEPDTDLSMDEWQWALRQIKTP